MSRVFKYAYVLVLVEGKPVIKSYIRSNAFFKIGYSGPFSSSKSTGCITESDSFVETSLFTIDLSSESVMLLQHLSE